MIKKIMQARVIADRKELTHEQWLNLRRTGIGGSDAGAICGLNSFSSPFSVYADKVGLTSEKPVSEAMRLGNDLEEYVAQRFTEATGKKVKRCNYVLQNVEHYWMLADVDRLIVGENAGLECKTTSAFNKTDFTKADIPPQYYAQCVHYMAVTGAQKWYIAILVLGVGFYYFCIDRNEEEINALLTIEQDFWNNNILACVEPSPDGTRATAEALSEMYYANEGQSVDLLPYRNLLEEYSKLNAQIKVLEREQEQIKQELQVYMANATEGHTDGYKVTWRQQERNTIDTKRLQVEHPEIYSAYAKKSLSRMFKITQIKDKEIM
jgi:putative phage-type endonuclease